MPYVGKEPVRGQNRELDDISGSFNGGNTAFTMQVGGSNTAAASANQVFISLGGVMQNPGTDFTVASSTLTFTTPPANGLDFWGLIQGDAVDIQEPADGSVTSSKIASGNLTLPGDVTIPDKIVHDGDTNTAIRFPAADTVSVETGGSERLRVDSSGRLLIGTTTNSGTSSSGDDIVIGSIGDSTSRGITFATTADATIRWADAGDNAMGRIQYLNNTDIMSFYTANSERLRIDANGIKFNGDTAAANGLSDYEQGTWTPECRIETRAASDSPTDAVDGCYTKVGRLVTCHGRFTLNGTPSERSTSRAIEIHGFPFDHNHDWDKISGDIRVTGWETGSTYGTDIYFVLRMLEAQQYCRVELMQQSYNGTRNGSVVMQDNMQVMFSFTYVTV